MSDLFKTITSVRPSSRDVESITTRQNQTPDITKAQQTADEALTHPPIGSMTGWAGQSDPPGGKWLICDGRLLNSLVFPALFNAIGQTWNLGDENAGEFRIPDMRSRTQVGAGQGTGLTNRVAGTEFGAETHTLSTAEMPSHSHTASGGSHSHSASQGSHNHGASGGSHSHGISIGSDFHSHSGATDTNFHNHDYTFTDKGATFGGPSGSAIQFMTGVSHAVVNSAQASHAHGFSTSGYSHGHSASAFTADATPSISFTTPSISVGSSTAVNAIANTGGGSNHNNMQPSAAAHFIIRAL